MADRFAGRRIAVIGGAGGIGGHLCRSLVTEGATVYALDRDLPESTSGITGFPVDVTSEASVVDLVRRLYADDAAPIDLVNSAGIVENDVAAEEMPMATYDAVMGVNLRGVFLACREFGRELLARGGGAIVNVASMSGNLVVNHPQKQSVYNSSKAGVSALTRSLAVEWGARGVRVNCVSPGYVDTPLNALKKEMHEGWIAGTVSGRFAHLTEISAAIEYLLSDESGYCLGTELVVDGGYSLR